MVEQERLLGKTYVFQWDGWIPITEETTISEGDLIVKGGQTMKVSNDPYWDQGKRVIPAVPYDPGAIILERGQEGREYICMAMDYTNSDRHTFEDGTAILASFDGGCHYVYSPRLPLTDLEAFCKANIDRYVEFFDKNKVEVDKGALVFMEPFWGEN